MSSFTVPCAANTTTLDPAENWGCPKLCLAGDKSPEPSETWIALVQRGKCEFVKKVREAQLAQYNYILVVGDEELAKETVNVRTRDNVQHGQKSVADVLREFAELTADFK